MMVLERGASRVTLIVVGRDAQPPVQAGCKRRSRHQEPRTFEAEDE